MNNILITIFCVCFISCALYLKPTKTDNNTITNIGKKELWLIDNGVHVMTGILIQTDRLYFKPIKKKKLICNQYDMYFYEFRMQESTDNYKCVNPLGYMGAYGFGHEALSDIGLKVPKELFLSNNEIQDWAFEHYLLLNKKRLRKELPKYNHKVVHGVYMTESGMLGAAHLGGAEGVKEFIYKGVNRQDINGTSISDYLKKFAGYKLNI